MKRTFREFVRPQLFPRMFREDEAAPATGSGASAPSNPDSKGSSKDHFGALQRQFGIEDGAMKAAIEGDSIELWQCPDYSASWGFTVNGPVTASVEQVSENSYKVTFHLKQKKLMSPKDFYVPKGNAKALTYYAGPVEDKTQVMTQEELAGLMTAPFANTGAAGGMPPMGGM